MATTLTEIPDHLLEEIFLRLPAPDDLARASAACVSFRRLVTEGSFLRRFRRLHAPPLLGFLDIDGFNPAVRPHPSAPGASALALAADFSFSFLPSHCSWTVQDTRDGLFLLGRDPEEHAWPQVYREFLVCDPLHRRYILLPPVPEEDLAASVEHPVPRVRRPWCEHFLVPLDEDSPAAFRVICVAHCETRLVVFDFSSSSRRWRAAASKALSDLACGRAELEILRRRPSLLGRNYAYGCFYWDWLVIQSEKLLVLDTMRMEFSMTDLPQGDWSTRVLAIVEAGDGRIGMFGFHHCKTAFDLRYNTVRDKSESPSQWQVERTISLDSGYTYYIKDATERYLLLTRTKNSSLEIVTEYFSVDIKTLKLQRLCAKQGTRKHVDHIYANFPPSLLSSPTI